MATRDGGVHESRRLVMISGCSGGGKSTLLAALTTRGYGVVEEPGRQVVKAQLAIGGDGLPWANVERFIALCVELAVEKWDEAQRRGGVSFFDRGIVDAVSGLQHLKLPMPPAFATALETRRYHERMFMAPPWPEIFANDDERRHSFANAVAEFERLVEAYGRLGYDVVMLPKIAVEARAAFVLEQLDLSARA